MSFDTSRPMRSDATTPNDMRAALLYAALHDPTLTAAFIVADRQGLSAEDRYTIVAYHQSLRAQETIVMLLKQIQWENTPSPFDVPSQEQFMREYVCNFGTPTKQRENKK